MLGATSKEPPTPKAAVPAVPSAPLIVPDAAEGVTVTVMVSVPPSRVMSNAPGVEMEKVCPPSPLTA